MGKESLIFVFFFLFFSSFSFCKESFPEMEREFGCGAEIGANYCFTGMTLLDDKNIALLNWKLEYGKRLKNEEVTRKVLAQLATSLLKSFNIKAANKNSLGDSLTSLLGEEFNDKSIVIGLNSVIGEKSYTTVTYRESNGDIITRTTDENITPSAYLLQQCRFSLTCDVRWIND